MVFKKIITAVFLITAIITFGQTKRNLQLKLTEENEKMYNEQGVVRCFTVEMDEFSRQQNPNRGTLEQFENWISPYINQYNQNRTTTSRAPVLTIPVVFHIITDGSGSENISSSAIQAQLNQLNIDFRNLAGSTEPVAADAEIEFCLATLDPSDNVMAEPGINRITTYGDGPFTSSEVDGTIKPGTQWDPQLYCNIWVADLSGGLLGWAQFPDTSGLPGLNNNGGAANTDGVVVGYGTVGSVASPGLASPYNLGRTLTHEIGHWAGLRHIWGDGNCSVDDFCADTPSSDASNFGCPTGHISCSTTDQIENYMDYTNDACMNLFTNDQKARIRTVFAVSPRRAELKDSPKCGAITPVIAFTSTSDSITEGSSCSFTDISVSLNIQSAPSADATVNFTIAGGTANNNLDYELLTSEAIFEAGSTEAQNMMLRIYHDRFVETDETAIIEFSVNANGGDAIANLNANSFTFTILNDDTIRDSSSNITLLSYDLESGGSNLTSSGSGDSVGWSLGNTAFASSTYWSIIGNETQFAFTNDDNCNCDKSNDRLTTTTIDLSGSYTSVDLSFDHAFADVSPESGDVLISTGGDFTSLSSLSNSSTNNGNGYYSTPWVNGVVINLNDYIGQSEVQFQFKYNDGGIWAYGMAVDNIEVTATYDTNVQTIVNSNFPDQFDFSTSGVVYSSDPSSGNAILDINNNKTDDYGCVDISVSRSGTGAQTFGESSSPDLVMDKIFDIEPTNLIENGDVSITFYFTEAEINGWETITSNSRNDLFIGRVNNGAITEVSDVTLGTFGSGVTLTGNFTNLKGTYIFGTDSVVKTMYVFNNSSWTPRDPNGISFSGDIIMIEQGDVIFSEDTEFDTLTVNPGASVTVEPSVTLSVDNSIILNSSSNKFSSFILNGSVSGEIIYNRYTALIGSQPTGTNDLIAAPLVNQVFGEFAAANPNLAASGNLRAFAPFNTNVGAYENYNTVTNATTPLTAGLGYRAATIDGSTLAFTGLAQATDVLDIPISDATAGNAWNLIGNPYPSYLDFGTFFELNKTQFHSEGAYQAIYGYDGDASNGWTVWNAATIADPAVTELIAPGQAFFVKSKTGGGLVDFTEAMRRIGGTDDFISGRTNPSDVALASIKLSTATSTSKASIYFIEGTTIGLDVGYDAATYGGSAPEFSIVSYLAEANSGLPLAIQSVPHNTLTDIEIPLGVNSDAMVSIGISLDPLTTQLPQGIEVYLEDRVANTFTLLNTTTYNHTPSSDLRGIGRYYLRFGTETLDAGSTALEALSIYTVSSLSTIVISGQLYSEPKAYLYDLQGRLVLSQNLDVSQRVNSIDVSKLSAGTYVIKVVNDQQIKTQKLVIKD